MRLGTVALKIRAANISPFGTKVYGAAEFMVAVEQTIKEEMAFVVPVSEMAQENKQDGTVIQKVVETFGVVCAIKNDTVTSDQLGLTAFDQLHNIRAGLFEILIGWLMPGAEDLTSYVGGTVLDVRSDYLWYQYNFRTAFFVQQVDTISSELDDLLRIYTEWMHDDKSRAVLPLTGDPPLLPNTVKAPDFITLIDYNYPFGRGFSSGFHTLESEFNNLFDTAPEEGT